MTTATLILAVLVAWVDGNINCTQLGPSYTATGDQAPGSTGWPMHADTVSECASLCWGLTTCEAYHYYASPDPAAGKCYLHAGPAKVVGPLNDKRLRYAGLCTGDRPIEDLCHLTGHFDWYSNAGNNTNGLIYQQDGDKCDEITMWANGTGGGGAFRGVYKIPVIPTQIYVISLEIKTENLVPVPPTTGCIESEFNASSPSHVACNGAYLTGGPYVSYFDTEGRADGWFPAFGSHAPVTSDWHSVNLTFSVPTTAVTMEIHFAFAAHTYAYSPNRMQGGAAVGQVWMRNISIKPTGQNMTVLPNNMYVPDTNITGAIEMASRCLHNSQLSGNFTVGSDYVISGNLAPDLAFGLFGTRRFAQPQYMQIWENTWALNRDIIMPNGQFGYFQRIMAQVLWPLGVDNIFSFTGNESYLEENLPFVDKSLAFLESTANVSTDGTTDYFPCFTRSFMENYPPGADWVDWQETRAYGSTTNFLVWYVKTLQRFAALHNEFKSSFGNELLAAHYSALAQNVTKSIQKILWVTDHFATNAHHSEDCSPSVMNDDVWLDDQIWSVLYNVANSSQHAAIWNWLEDNPSFESVPTRWSNKTGNDRYLETWYGRLGAGDVMMRYRTLSPVTNMTEPKRGLEMLQRISSAFLLHSNIYESYNMEMGVGGDSGTDYLEHCAGFIWSVTDGPFGLDFDSDDEAAATMTPQFDPEWLTSNDPAKSPTIVFYLRGVRIFASFSMSGMQIKGTGSALVKLRIVYGGKTQIMTLGGN